MADHAYILTVIQRALDTATTPDTSASKLVDQAMRVASLRRDYLAMLGFQLETLDAIPGHTTPRNLDMDKKLKTLLGEKEANRVIEKRVMQYMYNRAIDGTIDEINGASIEALENQLRRLRSAIADPAAVQHLSQADAYDYLHQIDKVGARLLPPIAQTESIISRIRQSAYTYLVESEAELMEGPSNSSIFSRGEEYVRNSLARRSPDTLEKYRAAEESIAKGTSESYAHALTSCRRMIKSLADDLYPATSQELVGTDGTKRKMGDDQYKNRLLQFVLDKIGNNTHNKVIQETMESLGNRLNRLHELSNKGVHHEVSRAEAESCLTWTFFLIADFLRIDDGTVVPSTGDTDSAPPK